MWFTDYHRSTVPLNSCFLAVPQLPPGYILHILGLQGCLSRQSKVAFVDELGWIRVCCSKNGSLLSLGCSTATQSHGNTRIVSSQTSKQYMSTCKFVLPHKRNDKYSAWELHDLNFSTAILHCLSKHSTGCILLSKVCFLLGFGYILKPISTIVMK